jgi:citrate lyase beta subunit
MEEVLNNAGGAEAARELARRINALSKTGMVQELETLAAKSPARIALESVQEAWLMALLSGPKTHLVNSMSKYFCGFAAGV